MNWPFSEPHRRCAPLLLHPTQLTPQTYLDAVMRSRGLAVDTYAALATAYYNRPSPLQVASYDVHLIALLKKRDCAALRGCLAAGLAPNPCNTHGESFLHTVCRLGDPELLKALLDAGGDLQCADDYGRTPLHDACWSVTPCWESIELILDRDVNLLRVRDCRQALPLSYVQKQHWGEWITFLQARKEKYFPEHGSAPPLLARQRPHSRPAPDPVNALAVDLARMVASGRLTPAEVAVLLGDHGDDESTDDDDDDDEGDDDDDVGDDSSTLYSADCSFHGDVNVAITFDDEESDVEDDEVSEVSDVSALIRSNEACLDDTSYSAGRLGISSPHYGNESFGAVSFIGRPEATPRPVPPPTLVGRAAPQKAEAAGRIVDAGATKISRVDPPLPTRCNERRLRMQDPVSHCQPNEDDGLLAFSC